MPHIHPMGEGIHRGEACPEASTQILFRLIPSLKRTGANMYLATSLFLNMEDLLVTLRDMEAWAGLRSQLGISNLSNLGLLGSRVLCAIMS